MKPLVSVIIPCYNQARFLQDAVKSVLAQTYPHWECIIVNDGSTDDTSNVARMLSSAESRIQVLEQTNKGLSGARNAGLRIARGQYIQFLDADDLIAPNKLQSQVTVLAAMRELALSYSDYRYCPENDATFTTTRDSFPPPRFVTGKPLWDVASRWETEFSIPVHCFLFDARFFIERDVSFDETLPSHEDWDCWMRIFALEPLVNHVPEPLAIYRLHDDAMCK
ncbi:MAG: glycosyltransferase family 2 protein, partial [Vicinamibacteria bacterium]